MVQLTDRDVELLNALWKWKMLTSAGIWKGFFADRSANTSYMRLWHLEKGGFIIRRAIDCAGRGFVWTLTPKGFRIVREKLPALKEDGYLSENMNHDYHVTAVHAGDWLVHRPSQVELFSEQELRRMDPDLYPDWVPQEDSHRADGYWRIPLQGKLVAVALEVELIQKSALRYRLTANFYEGNHSIFRVVWVVPSEALCKSIRAQFQEACPDTLDLHNFILLEDFKKLGWNATFIQGLEKGRPIKDLLNGGFRHSPGICRTLDLLDARKSPGRSKTSKLCATA